MPPELEEPSRSNQRTTPSINSRRSTGIWSVHSIETFSINYITTKQATHSGAYLGFHKGGKFSLDTNARGCKSGFPIFSYMAKTDFLPKGSMTHLPPPKYATGDTSEQSLKNIPSYSRCFLYTTFSSSGFLVLTDLFPHSLVQISLSTLHVPTLYCTLFTPSPSSKLFDNFPRGDQGVAIERPSGDTLDVCYPKYCLQMASKHAPPRPLLNTGVLSLRISVSKFFVLHCPMANILAPRLTKKPFFSQIACVSDPGMGLDQLSGRSVWPVRQVLIYQGTDGGRVATGSSRWDRDRGSGGSDRRIWNGFQQCPRIHRQRHQQVDQGEDLPLTGSYFSNFKLLYITYFALDINQKRNCIGVICDVPWCDVMQCDAMWCPHSTSMPHSNPQSLSMDPIHHGSRN